MCLCTFLGFGGVRFCLQTLIAVWSFVMAGKVMTGRDCLGHWCQCVSMSSMCLCDLVMLIQKKRDLLSSFWPVKQTHISYSVLSSRRCLSCFNWFLIRRTLWKGNIVDSSPYYTGSFIMYCLIMLDRVLFFFFGLDGSGSAVGCPSILILLVSV